MPVRRDDGAEHITYRIDNGMLERRVECSTGGSWVPPSSPSSRLPIKVEDAESGFAYVDAVGNQIGASAAPMSATLRDLIRRVRITLSLEGAAPELPGMPAPRYHTETDVAIRNFFDDGCDDAGSGASGSGGGGDCDFDLGSGSSSGSGD